MKKLLALILTPFLISSPKAADVNSQYSKASDEYVRNAVVKLTNAGGGCSGVQVKGALGGLYVLTAAHCRPLVSAAGTVEAEGEQGQKATLKFVAEDAMSDLMLLSGDKVFGSVDVAAHVSLHERLHAMTHGNLAPTFRTDGEALDEVPGGFLIYEGMTEKELMECLATPKYAVASDGFGEVCVLDVQSLRTTVQIIPGSSGGPMVNEAGELVGIASYGRRDLAIFGYFVRLVDIQSFLSRTAI